MLWKILASREESEKMMSAKERAGAEASEKMDECEAYGRDNAHVFRTGRGESSGAVMERKY